MHTLGDHQFSLIDVCWYILAADLHTPNSVKSHYYINFWIYIYLTTMNDASLSNNQNTSVFFKNARPTPRLLVLPQEVATSKGVTHPWRLTRQPKQPRTTVYELFRAQYLITVPNQYSKYTIPCVRSLHIYFLRAGFINKLKIASWDVPFADAVPSPLRLACQCH